MTSQSTQPPVTDTPVDHDHQSNTKFSPPTLPELDSSAPPPEYDAATAASSSAVRRAQRQANLEAEQGEGSTRAEDADRDERPLPQGWVKLWNSSYQHFYYVDTAATPPRSIWTHPLDDAIFLAANPQFRDLSRDQNGASGSNPTYAPPSSPPPSIVNQRKPSALSLRERIRAAGDAAVERAKQEPPPKGLRKISRNIKDNTTGLDHFGRRRQQAEQAEALKIAQEERHQAYQAFLLAARTGQPQWLGNDEASGMIFFADPPQPGVPLQYVLGSFPPPYGFESRKEGNHLFCRPVAPPMFASRHGMYGTYSRGGGAGVPIMGGLLGGALLGGLLF